MYANNFKYIGSVRLKKMAIYFLSKISLKKTYSCDLLVKMIVFKCLDCLNHSRAYQGGKG